MHPRRIKGFFSSLLGKPMPSRILKMAAAFAVLYDLHGTAMANDWQNATALEHAVLGGKGIHVALDLSRCVEHDSGKPGPDVRGSLHPDELMVQKDLTIAFDDPLHGPPRRDARR
jgi:VirK protein